MPNDESYLLDMLVWARRVKEFNTGLTWEQFAAQSKEQAATLHGLQVIGEAAGKVSQQFRQAHPEIDWTGIIGLRHRLVHDYSRIQLPVVWGIVTTDLDPLIAALDPLVPPQTP